MDTKAIFKNCKTVASFILMLMLGIWSCNNPSSKKTDTEQVVETPKTDVPEKKIFIKDRALYDQAFINVISTYPGQIQLIDDYIITSADTTYFPTILPLNVETVFNGKNNRNNFTLTVTRTSLTNLTYQFKLTDKAGKTVDTKSGTAILGMFFIGVEMDIDLESNAGYSISAYWDRESSCMFSIRIGNLADENGKTRAMVHYNCNDNKQKLDLKDCPILLTK